MAREASPAASEADLDFADTLLADDGEGALSDDSDSAFIDAAQQAANRRPSALAGGNAKAGKKSAGSAFQTMGLLPSLTKAIAHKGFKVPTPIQRKTIPLVLEHRDVVGMARTGSGKTAAFVIPMIQHLKAHTAKSGARAIIMSPSRELAIQTLRVVKELGKGTDLKTVLLVGGDSLEEHFAAMSGNPDIIIATPGRFLHIKVEMSLSLSSVEYIVFDEADRLFEMGFANQLTEVLHALPSTRQTLLFSATLPVSLVEFAKAGLSDPILVRLDVDSKISSDLESAFFSIQTTDKEGALLYLLSDVIQLDTQPVAAPTKKRRREQVAPKATIIFACTKHHVDYLATLLGKAGYRVSYIYGALDQTARRNQIDDFKSGATNILVVTDVAARGIDIPILANVINYDFPAQPKIFVHRVGRTARAGQRGWAYSLVRAEDCAYVLDLQLFLSRRLVLGTEQQANVDFTKDVVLGSLPRDGVERGAEWAGKAVSDDADFKAMKAVTVKGERLYLKTRPTASTDSIRRAKQVIRSDAWMTLSPLVAQATSADAERLDLLKRVGSFRPVETVFEIGHRGNNEAATVMRTRRHKVVIGPQATPDLATEAPTASTTAEPEAEADESVIEATFEEAPQGKRKKRKLDGFRDAQNYMAHYDPSANAMDHAYDVNSFAEAARHEQLDLATDEGKDAKGVRIGGKVWDSKQKKFVMAANLTDGSRGDKSRMIRGESGVKIPATYQAGRFKAWQTATKNRGAEAMPLDAQNGGSGGHRGGRGVGAGKYKHAGMKAPKAADKFRDDYHVQKKRVQEANERSGGPGAKTELKSSHQIRKDRELKAKRKDKNARPSKKGGKKRR